MVKKFKNWIEPATVPFSLAGLFILFIVIYRGIGLPSPSALAQITQELFSQYGVIILLIGAFLEGIFMISFYFPGSFVILLAVVVSDMTPASLLAIGLTSWFGFMLAGFANYLMGKHGYYKALLFLGKKDSVDKMRKWMDHYGNWTIFFTAIHPNYVSISLVCSGIVRDKLLPTMIVAGASLSFWIFIWILLATPIIRNVDLKNPNQSWYIVIALVLWGIVLILWNKVVPRIRGYSHDGQK